MSLRKKIYILPIGNAIFSSATFIPYQTIYDNPGVENYE